MWVVKKTGSFADIWETSKTVLHILLSLYILSLTLCTSAPVYNIKEIVGECLKL